MPAHRSADAPGSGSPPSSNLDRIRGEQARILFRNCPVGVIAAGTGAVLLAMALMSSGLVPAGSAVLWSGLMLACVAAHLGLCVAYWHRQPPDADWRRWLGLFTLIAALEGAVWFFGAIWMTSPSDLTQELIVLLVSSAIASGAVSVFGTYLPTYIAFFFPTIAPHLGFALRYDYPQHHLLAALIVAYLVAMTLIARRSNAQLLESLRLRFENLDLVESLRLQKALAEQANVAKSRFLASASHDLRQPIHALGLFVGALQERPMDDEARRLIGHIGGSVAAMDDLFASLLDISKLDAGAVEPRFEALALAPLLDRLCRDYREDAAAKGVALRHVGCSAAVRSDPVLLERALRNLLSNAVRYTDTGRIVVGCRRRAGIVTVEVWDTGVGIAPDVGELIFQEFYQVGNAERDRSKGLGLGLAIVRRTAALIDAELDFASVAGRGSVFRLTLPRAAAAAAPVPALQPTPPMRRALILCIDDETEIQTATARLLTGWGHRVIVAGSADEMLARTAADGETPDLIICDYRLRDSETGIAAIDRLRHRHGAAIPAMLITGDTAPDRIREASAGGYPLLHKPLSPSRLRAAVGNLLRDA